MVDPTVCHIPPTTPTSQRSPVNIPSIPPAEPNVQSLTQTVNAMRQVIQIITNQQQQPPNNGPGGQLKSPSPPASFVETHRVTEVVRVYQNDDKTSANFVDVEQTNLLVMTNKSAKQTWTYNRKQS